MGKILDFKNFLSRLKESVETKPREVETMPITKPRTNPLRPIKPDVVPEPKNYVDMLKNIISKYNHLSKPKEKEVETMPITKPRTNPLRPNKPDVVPEPKNRIKTFEEYEFDKDDSDRDVDMSGLMNKYFEIEAIEKTLNKEDLYRLAKDIIKEGYFKESKIMNFGDIIWDLEIVSTMDASSKIKKSGFDYNEAKDYEDDVNKREIINMMTQGNAKKAQEKLYDFSDNHDIESEYGIPKDLIPTYYNFMTKALKSHHVYDYKMMKNQPATGISYIKWDGDTPIIVCKGTNFIILLHEMIKGLHELFSYHGLSSDNETADYVNKKTSTWYHESEGLKWGHILVNKFDKFFEEVENYLIQDGSIVTKSNEMKMVCLTEFYKLDSKTFLEYCDALFKDKGDKPFQFFKEVYMSNIDIESVDDITKEEPLGKDLDIDFDYSKMGKSDLQKELDKALDDKDFKKAQQIGQYIKENFKIKK